jgi:hypothetical protein
LLSESQISLATARHLGKLGNAIVSLALPGDGSGVIFHPDNPSLPSFVPDIIARTQEGKYIVLESKPKYSSSDAEKLEKFRSSEYENAIKNLLGVGLKDIVTALAFGQDQLAPVHLEPATANPDIIYVVDIQLKCHPILNKCQLSNI